ncbi:DUF378 domain-containing protein [Oceanobacillus sp. Castelsardo]|uniref:DUF378 domain-containing protein n=1 Tax=Oceanobacillus sp. Castelsardo TaxID=1851204 RepID=UPI0008386520|nr:DUF378 domain-containing protein [Oceanobacillus sp. Castelsardo]
MGTLKRIALTLTIIGGVNWGLIGLFRFDLVAAIFGGQDAALSRVVYSLVGLSSLFCLTLLFESSDERNSVQTGRLNYGTEFGNELNTSNKKKRNDDLDKM